VVSILQTFEPILWSVYNQIIPFALGELKEPIIHNCAYCVRANVTSAGVAASVSKIPCNWVRSANFQICAENILLSFWHRTPLSLSEDQGGNIL